MQRTNAKTQGHFSNEYGRQRKTRSQQSVAPCKRADKEKTQSSVAAVFNRMAV